MAQLAASQDSDQCTWSAPSNSCMVRRVIAHFTLWRIIRAKRNMVESGTKQSKFCRTFWYQIRKIIVFFALDRLWFWSRQMCQLPAMGLINWSNQTEAFYFRTHPVAKYTGTGTYWHLCGRCGIYHVTSDTGTVGNELRRATVWPIREHFLTNFEIIEVSVVSPQW